MKKIFVVYTYHHPYKYGIRKVVEISLSESQIIWAVFNPG